MQPLTLWRRLHSSCSVLQADLARPPGETVHQKATLRAAGQGFFLACCGYDCGSREGRRPAPCHVVG